MKKFSLKIILIKEKSRYVAYAPALDLSSSGTTVQQAKRRIAEAAAIFFDEIEGKNTVADVLGDLGWKRGKTWVAPAISQESISIPALV